MKYYHGTTENRAESIEAEGFRGSELEQFTDGFKTLDYGGVVFVYDNVEAAQGYGEIVYEIELLNEQAIPFQEDQNGEQEYYIPMSVMYEDGIWKRIS
jgi:hypothetical protein